MSIENNPGVEIVLDLIVGKVIFAVVSFFVSPFQDPDISSTFESLASTVYLAGISPPATVVYGADVWKAKVSFPLVVLIKEA